MNSTHFAAIDLGAGSGRVVLASLANGKLSLSEMHRFSGYLIEKDGHLRWDVDRIFQEIVTGLRNIPGGIPVAGLGVDTWGVDFATLDDQGHLIEPPIAYRDARTNGMMELMDQRLPSSELYRMTGIQFMKFNTIYQLMAIREKQPELYAATNRCLLLPDYFAWLFTGVQNSEYTIATTTQLLDVQQKDWREELFRLTGFTADLFPAVHPPVRILGNLVLKDLPSGLRKTHYLSVASHDTASAVAAVPAQTANWIYISSGTWSLMGIETTHPILTEAALKNNFSNEGGVFGTYRILKNIMGMWILERFRQEVSPGEEYNRILTLADKIPAFRFFMDVDDPRFLNPPSMKAAIDHYLRQTGQNTPIDIGEYYRLIFDNLALKYYHVMMLLRQMTGRNYEAIHIIGGGSRNELLCRLTANLTGLPVFAGPVEATAIGNVLMQAAALGVVSGLAETRQLARNSFDIIEYRPKSIPNAADVYQSYLATTGQTGLIF